MQVRAPEHPRQRPDRGPAPPDAVPRARLDRWGLAAVLAIAALPTLIAAARPAFVADDWGFLDQARHGPWTWWIHGIDVRSRPLQAAYHGVTFDLLRGHVTAHLILLAALQATAAWLLVRLVARFASWRTALAVGLAWAVLPNRGSTRLWISAAPVSLSIVLLLIAALVATRARPTTISRWVVVAVASASVLTYEGGAVVALLVVAVAWWPPDTEVVKAALQAAPGLAVYGAVVVWNVSTSPKGVSGSAPLISAVDALVGHGLAPRALGAFGVAALVVLVGWGAWLGRGDDEVRRLWAVGAIVAVAGSLPFLVSGFEQVVEGPGDRANAFACLGVALMIGAAMGSLARHGGRPMIAAATVGALLLVAGLDDVSDVRRAGDVGTATVAAFARSSGALPAGPLVLAPAADHGEWIPFGYASLPSALRVDAGLDVDVRDPRYALGPVAPDETVVRETGGRIVVVDRPAG